ncbi:MAG: ATP-grasp domain-containing protein [Planctomycetes bacterium]|jgi:biotin carboxylase|nr:ATP-grasp domain-containing protein [Planctomycetota bacterium]MCL4729736.1 ATP-grasp domain-containing protein [Planctomycetota bacterium]
MRHILIPFPTLWDDLQFEACKADWSARFLPHFTQPRDFDVRWDFDVRGFIAAQVAAWRGRAAGVFSSSDYPGAFAAAAIADQLGLCGPGAANVLRAAHKLRARQAMNAVAPVKHALVDPAAVADPPFGFPCFVKPVKGTYSMFARRVADAAQLRAFLGSREVQDYTRYFLRIFNELWAEHTGDPVDGRFFIAEEPLAGAQVTVEGMVTRGHVTIFGVVDTVFHPGTQSFARFVYPSRLPHAAQSEMARVATAAVAALGMDNTLFNFEMFWDAGRGAQIIEFNPRLCGQFGDLYQRVDGKNSYVAALELACGLTPEWPRRQGAYRIAASVPLRVFRPVHVQRAPKPVEVREINEGCPEALIWSEVATGMNLDDFHQEDGASVRYGVINLAADSETAILARCEEIRRRLGFEFVDLEPGA